MKSHRLPARPLALGAVALILLCGFGAARLSADSPAPAGTQLRFSSPEEAVKALGVFQPDCVMMGISLPAPGAYKAIRTIRKTYPEVRVLAVSSLHEPALRQAALRRTIHRPRNSPFFFLRSR